MIESAGNWQVKNVTKLLKNSRERRKQNSYIIEGPKMVIEAIASGVVSRVYISESMWNMLKNSDWNACSDNNRLAHISAAQVRNMLEQCGYDVIKDNIFAGMTDTVVPQGMLAVASMSEKSIDDILSSNMNSQFVRYIILENLQDPGNLGTIIRTAEAAGFQGVFMNKGTVDIYNPKVVRSTMGAMLRVPYAYCDSTRTIIDRCKSAGVSLAGAALGGTDIRETVYPKKLGIMIGNESNGLTDIALSGCNMLVRIPMAGNVESLNASVAAGVLMYMSSLFFL